MKVVFNTAGNEPRGGQFLEGILKKLIVVGLEPKERPRGADRPVAFKLLPAREPSVPGTLFPRVAEIEVDTTDLALREELGRIAYIAAYDLNVGKPELSHLLEYARIYVELSFAGDEIHVRKALGHTGDELPLSAAYLEHDRRRPSEDFIPAPPAARRVFNETPAAFFYYAFPVFYVPLSHVSSKEL